MQEAQILLRAAAEVEHAVLVEYLYAGWSILGNPISDTILEIAIQEMCHFITVQNLMMFVGSFPSVVRQDQDPAPALDPFPFTLRPFSQPTLEDFLLTEMPVFDSMTPDQKTIMEPIIRKAQKQGRSFHPVGVVYAKLYWLFQENDLPTAPWPDVAGAGFKPGRHIDSFSGAGTAATVQADGLVERAWNSGQDRAGVFEKVDSRTTGLKAIFDIASQGEGPTTSSSTVCHFDRFIDVYKTTDFSTLPAVPWPTDPFVASAPSDEFGREANRITNPPLPRSAASSMCAIELRSRASAPRCREIGRTTPISPSAPNTYTGASTRCWGSSRA